MTDGLIIIGASLAGAQAAAGARAAGWTGAIRLIGAEHHLPYARPPLSKAVLSGQEEPAAAEVHPADFYASNDIELVLGNAATDLDLDGRTVALDDDSRLVFDKVILATGSSPRSVPVPGADLGGVHALRTVDDSLALRERLVPGARVAAIGASWIGTEVAAAARRRGAEVSLIDPHARPLERVLGAEVGRYFADLHEDHGCHLHMGVGVEAILGDSSVSAVKLADGTEIATDLVVIGVGVVPNLALAQHAGLDTDHGVLVDEHLQTSHPDVYAAGDIAEALHPLTGARVRVEHWANAKNQGLTAGHNVAGSNETYDRIPYFFSDQYDTGMEYSGWPGPWDQVVFRGTPADGAFVAFYLDKDRVVGGANINVWDVNEHVQRLLRSTRAVDPDVLTDESVKPEDW